jgi:DHA1 family tetracycline resistance protein-like MFS transporter
MRKNNKAAVGFIFVTLLLDVIGLGIIIPVIPALIQELTGSTLSEASQYGGWLIFAYAFFQFVFAPIVGGLSDRFGRRPVLLLSLFGFGINYLLLAFAPTIAWLFIGRIISGIFGASYSTGAAYIADVSSKENRAQNFGLIGVAFGVGFIIGPVIGGVLGEIGSRIPFFAAAGLSIINWLYGVFVLPESLPESKRRPFDWRKANPIGSLMALKHYPAVASLVGTFAFIYLGSHAVHGTWSYFTMEKFAWSESMVGYSLGAVGIASAIVQGGLIRVIIPKIGEYKTLIFGLLMNLIGLLLFAFSPTGFWMFVFIAPYCLGGFAGPALQAIVTKQVPDNEQGQLQGTLTSTMSATAIVGPLLMTSVFAYFTSGNAPFYFPGAAFIVAAVFVAIALVIIVKRGEAKTTGQEL